eukprot:3016013-Prymnesium_polylepis.1
MCIRDRRVVRVACATAAEGARRWGVPAPRRDALRLNIRGLEHRQKAEEVAFRQQTRGLKAELQDSRTAHAAEVAQLSATLTADK